MTVAELIDLLSQFPEDMRVVKADDAEGNGFRQIYATDFGFTPEADAWLIETLFDPDDFEYEIVGCEEEQDWSKVVVLW
jgi:hypothetical protein